MFLGAPRSFLAAVLLVVVPTAAAGDGDRLAAMSLEDLLSLEVVSVSRTEETYDDVAAAAYVLTREDFVRSGATSLPEALRAVPGLHVAQISSSQWAVSARGFNGLWANKLLVLVDGRPVFSPLFSGVFWQLQDIPLSEIERVEVIRGPGGAAWGANAVNGVINVLTRKSGERPPASSIRFGTGGTHAGAIASWGTRAGPGSVSGYARQADRVAEDPFGDTRDVWSDVRGGVRVGYPLADRGRLSMSADAFRTDFDGLFRAPGIGDVLLSSRGSGGNVVLAAEVGDRSGMTSARVSFDEIDLREPYLSHEARTYDLEIQRSQSTGPMDWTLGAGARRWEAEFTELGDVIRAAAPDAQRLLWSGFLQVEWTPEESPWSVSAGARSEKLGDRSWWSPTLRTSYRATEHHFLWSSVSRAVGVPSITMDELSFHLPPTQADGMTMVTSILPDSTLEPERLTSYEVGYRGTVSPGTQVEVTGFANRYENLIGWRDALRVDVSSGTPIIRNDNYWSSGGAATSVGAEISADLWRLPGLARTRIGYTWQRTRLDAEDPGYRPIHRPGANPRHQAFATTTAPVGPIDCNITGRFVSRLEEVLPADPSALQLGQVDSIPAHGTIDAAVRWSLGRARMSVGGRNLLGSDVPEYQDFSFGQLPATPVRTYYTTVSWEL